METINQVSTTYTEPYSRKCISCRAVIIENGKILLSHESKTGFYMSPGGSLEEGETHEGCVEREVLEETGFIVRAVKPFVTVNEYCYDTLYVSNYYICEIIGTGESSLTPTEDAKGMVPRWVEIEKAIEIFGEYKKQTPDKESLYLREFTILNRVKQNNA